ncbi:hypothetical protein H2202_007514 [Exophiala xenobiotica]|nr:hypothetical protein H2202_007514 [Exophiala xenobiotica]
MRCRSHTAAPHVEQGAGDKNLRKNTITEARREQNRRAQRAFREFLLRVVGAGRSSDVFSGERHRAKNRLPPNTTSRQLAPRPTEGGPDVNKRSSETDIEIVDRTHDSSNQDIPTLSTSDQGPLDGLQHQHDSTFCTTKEAPFTFTSPQTLLPAHESLVPKRRTPSSELTNFMRDHPKPALWPHGVTSTLAACLFNALALGIDIDRVTDPQYMSPFYQPSLSLVLTPPAGSASAVQSTNFDADFASDPQLAFLGPLRPCLAQVLFPHHACIDLLPLPRLRETAVMLNVRAAQQAEGAAGSTSRSRSGFDGVQELKKDVYVRQGVRFRGTGELTGDEYIMYDERRVRHCGHPWESGSWAIAPWFARKWKHLVDMSG